MEITQEVAEQYDAIRREGEINMMQRTSVKRIARARDFTELAQFIDSGNYPMLLSNYDDVRERHDL